MASNTAWQLFTAAEDGIRIELLAQRAVNLALAHNRVPLIERLTVTNTSDRSAVDTTVSVELRAGTEELAPCWRETYDGELAAGESASWSNLQTVLPDLSLLSALNESRPANIVVTVTRLWGQAVRLVVPIEILAHNEWFNAPVFYDSLAAFVQPNTRAVQGVLATASDLLRTQTGDSSIGGYQSGPERAAYIAAAIYESLRTHDIRYVSPPPSFEDTGQKVRTTAEVLDSRLGTCIDLSVTYAACLEAAGLRPLVWLTKTHAFAGFMREDAALLHTSMTEPNSLINLVESKSAIPVEAIYYETDSAGTFSAAVATGARHMLEPENLRAVIDISAARRDGVRPLPTTDDAEIASSGSEGVPAQITADRLAVPTFLTAAASDDAVLDNSDNAPLRVRKWKRALLDLSTRNRLLNLRESAQVIELLVPPDGLSHLDNLIHAEKSISIAAVDDVGSLHALQGARSARDIDGVSLLNYLIKDHTMFASVSEERYPTRLKGLQRTARTLFEETGSSNLYLTLGALIHRTSTGRDARAPLFLLPIRIVGGTGRSRFQILVDTATVATPNYCLVEWLRVKHNVSVPELESPPLDESGIDIESALRGIRKALLASSLDFRIDEIATIAICQFSTFGMWQDLHQHWDVLSQNPLVEHLTFRPGESFIDPQMQAAESLDEIEVQESEVVVPISADGSQLRAVALAAAGHTFVLEGPPGTGKSQTITNLIAYALKQRKTVLFVAEKQAALEVVKRRLSKIGLANFTLDLHGKNQTPSEIRAQLKEAMDHQARYAAYAWETKLADYKSRYAALETYPEKIHSKNPLGFSLWAAAAALTDDDRLQAPVPPSYVKAPAIPPDQIRESLRQFGRVAKSLDLRPDSPWLIVGRVNVTDAPGLVTACRALSNAVAAVSSDRQAIAIVHELRTPEQVDAMLVQAKREANWPVIEAGTLRHFESARWQTDFETLGAEVRQLRDHCRSLYSVFNSHFITYGNSDALVQEAIAASHGLIGKKKRSERFSSQLAPALLPGVSLTPEEALPLLRSIPGARAQAIHVKHRMAQLFGPFASPMWDPLAPNSMQLLEPALDYINATAKFTITHVSEWATLRRHGPITAPAGNALAGLTTAWRAWLGALQTDEDQLPHWQRGAHWFDACLRDLPAWTDDADRTGMETALRWSSAMNYLSTLRSAGLTEFAYGLMSGSISAADGETAFLRGIAAASVEERRRANALDSFDAELRIGEIDDFVSAAETLRTEQHAALPAQLLARRTFRPGAFKGKSGTLRRLLEAKRGGLTFRNLMEQYADEILEATPCFFVSPSSLAQFVPPGSAQFDLVVFDEASQITVAQAIGAIGRGRSTVIVGDSQQMPPTAIGQVSLSDDSDDDESTEVVPEDLDSILTECVESQVPRIWLSWHYRSQDEALIAFSNHHYYENRLASLPSPGGDPNVGIEWHRVNGHFNREDRRRDYRTNRVEAEAIVAEIERRVADPVLRSESIGVVTFNQPQQELILNLLESAGNTKVSDLLRPDAENGIFVKNLENVQGDERDVALFSTAFSKRPADPKLPLNFGPLTRTGGEKRLNVAVTRARRKVVVYSSFDPADIDLTRTRSIGMAHLRTYLEAAQRGGLTHEASSKQPEPDGIHEAIARALQRRGYEVARDYGLSDFVVDIAVKRPESSRWQVAVMTDGPRWGERPTVADRDLTPHLLEPLMKWASVVRVWLPGWLDHSDRVLDRIDEAVQQAEAREHQLAAERAASAAETQKEQEYETPDTNDADPRTPALTISEAVPDAQADDYSQLLTPEPEHVLVRDVATASVERLEGTAVQPQRDWHGRGTPFQEAPSDLLGARDDLDRINSRLVRRQIEEGIRQAIEAEGPIAVDRLARSVVRRFGWNRASDSRQAFVRTLIPSELIRRGEFGDFVWPSELDPADWRGFRTTPEGIVRPLHEIAPEEIINAMSHVCRRGLEDREAVMRETLAVFNQKRLTAPTKDRLDRCIDRALQTGRLVWSQGVYVGGHG
ncbi:DUF4011 domain-containing protein [Skermania sp. ID1734]|uniref:DUF4011 domain-containing protein n=1 Tax=Skermania sp. ID1734 TaxID=2597516 RepID=UPI0011801FFC|nr:DUF4011 domain-containing protein [Skermania sp. ID1734]TSE01844.1 DUF4011 domain-containing protein [Skermania sp. ID1734]